MKKGWGWQGKWTFASLSLQIWKAPTYRLRLKKLKTKSLHRNILKTLGKNYKTKLCCRVVFQVDPAISVQGKCDSGLHTVGFHLLSLRLFASNQSRLIASRIYICPFCVSPNAICSLVGQISCLKLQLGFEPRRFSTLCRQVSESKRVHPTRCHLQSSLKNT